MGSTASPGLNDGGNGQSTAEAYQPIDDILHQLAGHLDNQALVLEDRTVSVSEEIILDRTVGAVRYLLIRMPAVMTVHAPLSPREQEIARMVANGHPTKVIAGVLNISCWTVTAHLRRIFTKLGVTSRAAMVARLLEESRNWDVRFQAEKPHFDTKAIVDTSTVGTTCGTHLRTSVRA
jgi:DNA-binding CsgD family transcriptional regulator